MGLELEDTNGHVPLEDRVDALEEVAKEDAERWGRLFAQLKDIREAQNDTNEVVVKATGELSEFRTEMVHLRETAYAIAKGMGVSIPPKITRDSSAELEKKVEAKTLTRMQWVKLIAAATAALGAAAVLMERLAAWLGN